MTDNEERPFPIDSLNRRTYLKAAVGGVGLAAIGATTAASDDDYEVVTVGAGETYRVSLGDDETFENVLIDISAKGAGYEIVADGDNWEIRNVGIRGEWDHIPNNQPFRVAVPSEDATGVIDTVYLGDGVNDISGWRPSDNPSGIWTYWYHAGEIDVYRVNIQEFPDNALYCSQAGNSNDHPNPGSNGIVRVHDSYMANNKTSNLRLGTDGSYAENCVLWNNYHKGHWQFYNSGELIDCDIGPADGRQHLSIGSGTWDSGANASLTVTNTRFDEGGVRTRRGAMLNGSAAGEPIHRMPDGCPTTPEEAAGSAASSTSGEPDDSSSDDDSAEESSDDESPADDPPTGDFTIEAATGDDLAEYLLELDADAVKPGSDANDFEHEYEDRAIEVDGRWYVHGYVAEGGTDNFHVEGGEILRVGELLGSVDLTADGRSLDPSSFEAIDSIPTGGPHIRSTLVFDGRESDTQTTGYEFVVTEGAERTTDEGATIDTEDVVDGTHASGTVANYLDAWQFDGRLERLRVDGDAEVRVNGVRVDPDSFEDV